jgi:hypothetical protein
MVTAAPAGLSSAKARVTFWDARVLLNSPPMDRAGSNSFILLNLALSFQAHYAAPFISENRQHDIDRKSAENDRQISVKAVLETEVLYLTEAVKELTAFLGKAKIDSSALFPRRRPRHTLGKIAVDLVCKCIRSASSVSDFNVLQPI